MRVMFDVTDPVGRMHTMTKREGKAELIDLKALLTRDADYLRTMVESIVQATLEAEMAAALQAGKGERTAERLGYRSGYYGRLLVTRVGTLELRVPQDRQGRFSTELFERYQRAEKALVASLVEMYVQGVSTRKVKAITEELCGHSFSASSVSAVVKKLDTSLKAFFERRLKEAYPYLVLDARYERVREGGVIHSQAVLVAIGIDWEGRRQALAVDLANRESRSSWKDFLLALKQRGLHGIEFVVSCQCRLNFPQKCRGKIPQAAGRVSAAIRTLAPPFSGGRGGGVECCRRAARSGDCGVCRAAKRHARAGDSWSPRSG
jgi:transposase-like protein